MNSSPHFQSLLDDMLHLHMRKNHDYAHDNNPFSNFEEAAAEAGVTVDQVFKVMVGIKNARIRELERSGKDPANESLADSYMDRLMYCALQFAYRRSQASNELSGAEYGHGV